MFCWFLRIPGVAPNHPKFVPGDSKEVNRENGPKDQGAGWHIQKDSRSRHNGIVAGSVSFHICLLLHSTLFGSFDIYLPW